MIPSLSLSSDRNKTTQSPAEEGQQVESTTITTTTPREPDTPGREKVVVQPHTPRSKTPVSSQGVLDPMRQGVDTTTPREREREKEREKEKEREMEEKTVWPHPQPRTPRSWGGEEEVESKGEDLEETTSEGGENEDVDDGGGGGGAAGETKGLSRRKRLKRHFSQFKNT